MKYILIELLTSWITTPILYFTPLKICVALIEISLLISILNKLWIWGKNYGKKHED